MTCNAIEHDFSLMDGKLDETNQEVDNLQRWVVDLEGKLVKLAALEATFNHFTNDHWIPLQAFVLSLHDSLCWVCKGNGEPVPDRVRSASAPPSLSIAIPIPPPCIGQRPLTPGPPPLSPITNNESSVIPDSSTNSSPNPFRVERRTFQAAQGPDGLVWTEEERAALQAFLSNFESEEGVSVTILEAGERDSLQEALECFQKVLDLGKEELEHDVMGCQDCWVQGDVVHCEKSKFHPQHCCPPWQNCYCLALEYSSDLSAPHPSLY